MTYKEFLTNKSAGKNFSLTPGNELTFLELFCTITNDGDNPFKMEISEKVFNVMMNAVLKVFLPIRLAFGKSLTISSGIRSQQSYDRLIKKGYNPAKTSDHFYGQNIGGITTTAGAFDIVPSKGKARELFDFLLKHLDRKTNSFVFNGVSYPFGQLLIEKGKVSEWVHISADRTKLDPAAKPYSIRVGESLDNGKSFVPK